MISELKCDYNFIPKKELLRRNDFGIKKEFIIRNTDSYPENTLAVRATKE
jgi:hypothetical protein